MNRLVVSFDDARYDARCAHENCGRPMAMILFTKNFSRASGGVPACTDHWVKIEKEDVVWDGVWQRFLPQCGNDYTPLFEEGQQKTHSENKKSHDEVADETMDADVTESTAGIKKDASEEFAASTKDSVQKDPKAVNKETTKNTKKEKVEAAKKVIEDFVQRLQAEKDDDYGYVPEV